MNQGLRNGGAPSGVPAPAILEWRPFEKNTLRGFFAVQLPSGMVLHQCTLHRGRNSDWIGFPASAQVRDGQAVVLNGKQQYNKLIEIPDRQRRDAFQASVLAALYNHPEVAESLGGTHG